MKIGKTDIYISRNVYVSCTKFIITFYILTPEIIMQSFTSFTQSIKHIFGSPLLLWFKRIWLQQPLGFPHSHLSSTIFPCQEKGALIPIFDIGIVKSLLSTDFLSKTRNARIKEWTTYGHLIGVRFILMKNHLCCNQWAMHYFSYINVESIWTACKDRTALILLEWSME